MNLRKITICGGGNGAHALLAHLARNCDCQLTLYLPLKEEFRHFQEVKKRGTPFRTIFKDTEVQISMDKLTISQAPREAATADLIILVLPAFAHQTILDALVPYLQPGTIVAALPAKGGFEFQVSEILSRYDHKGIIIAGFQTLPWACRIKEYAQAVEIYGVKEKVGLATLPRYYAEDVAPVFKKLFGVEFVPYNNVLAMTLGNIEQIFHPGILYGVFGDKLKKLYRKDEIPLFYQSVDERTADLLKLMSHEILNIKEAIESNYDIVIDGILSCSQWLLWSYGDDVKDKTNLARMFQTNCAYQGLQVPTKSVNELYQIDINSRYLREDVPYGLLVSRAIGTFANVATPKIDGVIEEVSSWGKAQYLAKGKLIGKDLEKTRIPQNFGFRGLKSIIEMIARDYLA